MWLAWTLACEHPTQSKVPGEPTQDQCPDDPDKSEPGACGCGVSDADPDGDGVASCAEGCPDDPEKREAGVCGCGATDDDDDGDGLANCEDPCPTAGGGAEDGDEVGVGDDCDVCPTVPDPGQEDLDGDGTGDACWCDPQPQRCVAGSAGEFPCSAVDLLSVVPLSTFRAASTNDVWGWTDEDGTEYALVGLSNGTGFLNLANPYCPVVAGFLPAESTSSLWRDLETVGNWVVVGSEANDHGLQLFDLTHLRGATDTLFAPDAVFTGVGSSHTVTIDPASGTVAANGADTCEGMLFVDVSDPLAPRGAGCFDGVGYVHDAQCVTYRGPDTEWAGRVVCVAAAGETGEIVVVDATDLDAPVELGRLHYGRAAQLAGGSGFGYSHQGWFTEDHRYWVFDDELDELVWAVPTTTFVFDLGDLQAPALVGQHVHETTAIDHNQYIVGNRTYQSNYTAGLRILDLTGVADAALEEVAFFDVYPRSELREFEGTWSNYPFFASGVIPVTSIGEGLVLVRPSLAP
jgi:choice-of-anchor B domain-containing protein